MLPSDILLDKLWILLLSVMKTKVQEEANIIQWMFMNLS